jgi:hypothetical protein
MLRYDIFSHVETLNLQVSTTRAQWLLQQSFGDVSHPNGKLERRDSVTGEPARKSVQEWGSKVKGKKVKAKSEQQSKTSTITLFLCPFTFLLSPALAPMLEFWHHPRPARSIVTSVWATNP